jgi:hypothetical protein
MFFIPLVPHALGLIFPRRPSHERPSGWSREAHDCHRCGRQSSPSSSSGCVCHDHRTNGQECLVPVAAHGSLRVGESQSDSGAVAVAIPVAPIICFVTRGNHGSLLLGHFFEIRISRDALVRFELPKENDGSADCSRHEYLLIARAPPAHSDAHLFMPPRTSTKNHRLRSLQTCGHRPQRPRGWMAPVVLFLVTFSHP